LLALQHAWAGRLAFMGGVSEELLQTSKRDLIEATVRQICREAAPGGFVLGSATGITERIPPENFVALVEAAQWYGRRAAWEPATEAIPTSV
jgi:uroporphyrinogen-III decarboxylase